MVIDDPQFNNSEKINKNFVSNNKKPEYLEIKEKFQNFVNSEKFKEEFKHEVQKKSQ